MKVAIVSGAARSKDSVRGIGVHNSELFKAFKEGRNKDIDIPEVGSNDDLSKFDVVHFTSFRPFFRSLPFFKPKNTKFVLTIHDLIPLLYPNVYKPGIRGSLNYYLNKILVKKFVDAIITISETSKKDIVRLLNVNPEIVHVIYIAPKKAIRRLKSGKWENEIKTKYNLPNKFVLFDHGVNYNKNVPTLIEACRKAKIPLAIVGKETENIGKLDLSHPELAHLKNVDFSNVLKLGFVNDEDLNKLFNLATVCIQPSFYEGFGLPPIEAMTVGCPVICSKTQALVEVCDDACLYFDPNDVDELIEKIKLMSSDSKVRNKFIKKGFEQVKKYSWRKTADETLDVYAKCI